MPIRYSDINTTAGAGDFVVRYRPPTPMHLVALFAFVLIISIGISFAAINRTAQSFLLIFGICATGWYAVVNLQRSRDTVLATEFQNALFASALGINSKFCLITRRDGSIVYIDRSFQEMFPDFSHEPRRTVDTLLDHGNVSHADKERIFSAIERGVYDKAIFNIRAKSGVSYKIVMSVEPILRPSGYILLRGREYVVRSSANDSDTPADNFLEKSTISLFSYVVDSMNMGVYMVGPDGQIVYANPVIEQWLGFRDGEITGSNLSLQDIVAHGKDRPESIKPDNYEGDILLRKKNGTTVSAFINQKIICDNNGKLIGCTAVVHQVSEAASEIKKKLW
jgi:PAS domain S-box-containing protein